MHDSPGDPLVEHGLECPYCGEPITVLLDLSVPEQRYVEDCEVCCRPIELMVRAEAGALAACAAARSD